MSADEAYELEVTDAIKFKALWTNNHFSQYIVKVTDLYVYLFIRNDAYVCIYVDVCARVYYLKVIMCVRTCARSLVLYLSHSTHLRAPSLPLFFLACFSK
jgi:hypothetical protein